VGLITCVLVGCTVFVATRVLVAGTVVLVLVATRVLVAGPVVDVELGTEVALGATRVLVAVPPPHGPWLRLNRPLHPS
jgi:hypothetical protein